MTDLVLAMMAGLLGASTLAIVLLYRGWKSNRQLITDLKAQVAVQQITALTGGVPVSAAPETDDQEPARRKGHLALYIGGGVVAAFWTIGDRIRSAWRGHRALTVTAATVATVSTAAAIYLVPTGDSSPTSEAGPGIAAVPDYSPGRAGSPDNDAGDLETEDQGPTVPFAASPLDLDLAEEPDEDAGTPSPDSSDGADADADAATEEPDPHQTEEVPEDAAATPPGTPGGQVTEPQPGQGESPAPDPTPDPTPDPDPTPAPDPSGKPPKGDDGLLCLDVPPLLDLCLL